MMRAKELLLLLCAVAIAVFLANGGIIIYRLAQPSAQDKDLRERAELSKKAGLPFDSRTPIQVFRAIREKSPDIIPLAFPFLHLDDVTIDGRNVLPLSGISNATSVHSNECGNYAMYHTDEFGFHNPMGTQARKSFDVAPIGDSYTFGFSVEESQNISERLKAQGIPCINYGHGGNGPMLELATLQEYALDKDVRQYVWLYCGANDLDDLEREGQNPVLLHYLNSPDFRQGLQAMVPALDAALKTDAEKALLPVQRSASQVALDFLLLRGVRGLLGLSVFNGDPLRYEKREPLLAQVLSEALRRIEKRGAHMLIVYLPSQEEFVAPDFPKRMPAMKAIAESGADFLDMTPVFQATGDPLRFFPFRLSSHYNAEGYALVAQAIQERLRGRLGRAVAGGPEAQEVSP